MTAFSDETGRAAIKPLEWQGTFIDRGDGSKDQAGWEADTGFGVWYEIEQYFGSDSYGYRVSFDYEMIGDHDDPDQAKATAQKHFEKRIRAALSAAPVAQEPVAGESRLRDLARQVREVCRGHIAYGQVAEFCNHIDNHLNAIARCEELNASTPATSAGLGADEIARGMRAGLVGPTYGTQFVYPRSKETESGIPTRSHLQHFSPAEIAIYEAVTAVEGSGGSAALTEAVNFLHKARERVADHMEGDGSAAPSGAVTVDEIARATEALFQYFCPSIRMKPADVEYYGGAVRVVLALLSRDKS